MVARAQQPELPVIAFVDAGLADAFTDRAHLFRKGLSEDVHRGLAAWPLMARAQQPSQMRRVGLLLPAPSDDAVFQT
jgi:hypothetical protein